MLSFSVRYFSGDYKQETCLFQCTLDVVLGFIDFYLKVGKYKREKKQPMVALHNGIYIFLVTFVLQLLFPGIFGYSC